MKTIEEKNAIIAEFMGLKFKDDDTYISELKEMRSNGVYFEQGYMTSELKYHTSWDWLMPVVDSIYNTGMDEQTTNEIGDVTHALLDINIQSTHDAVISFIEFYNQNK
jgi:hypothetical protein